LKNFGLTVLNKNQGSMQKRNLKRSTMIKPSQKDSRTSGTKESSIQEGSQNQEKDISEIQCFNCQKYGHYRNQCPELKKRKKKHEASIAEEKEPTKKTKQDGRDFFY
jgi:hypothetical protein